MDSMSLFYVRYIALMDSLSLIYVKYFALVDSLSLFYVKYFALMGGLSLFFVKFIALTVSLSLFDVKNILLIWTVVLILCHIRNSDGQFVLVLYQMLRSHGSLPLFYVKYATLMDSLSFLCQIHLSYGQSVLVFCYIRHSYV